MLIAPLLAAPLILLGISPSHASAAAPHAAELVYVANEMGAVDAYKSSSTGAVTPLLKVSNPKRPDTYWDPWGVTFDSSGNLYVQSFLSDATTFVFGVSASGAPQLIRVFRVYGPDSRSIAVDGNGYEYVGSGDGAYVIAVAAPEAQGKVHDSYDVRAVRTISPNESGFQPWPDILAEGASNELVAAILRRHNNAIETFDGGPNGSKDPSRVISGPDTGLGSCSRSCEDLSLAFSPLTNCIYVAVSDGSSTHISVFRGLANGDVAPLRTIEGERTGLSGRLITGIAISPASGSIYVMVKAAEFSGPARIEVFSGGASGNTAPIRTFTDQTNRFADAMGIAIQPG
jgi:hypothetical protein